MRLGRVIAGCLSALLLASCGGKVKAAGIVPIPTNYDPYGPGATASPLPMPSTAPTPKPTGFGTVHGEVRDVRGRGMANVKVTVDGASDASATSSFDGTFTLKNAPAGWQFITFHYDNQVFAGAVDVEPNAEIKMDPVTFDNRYAAFGNQANGSYELPRKKFPFTWKITNVAAWSGSVYVTAVDDDGLIKDGTVFRLNLRQDKKWDQIGDRFLILKPLSYTASGLAVAGDKLYVADSKKGLYRLDPEKGAPKRADKTGYKDVAAGGGKVFLLGESGVSAADASLEGLTPLAGFSATGGIGADPTGILYGVSGNSISKYGTKAETFVTGLNSPIDVAADRQGFVYVLEPGGVKRFDKTGKLVGSFPSGAETPVGICVDESGAVFVADQGSGTKSSRVLRFTPATTATTPQPQPSGWGGYGYGYDSSTGSSGSYDPYATSSGSSTGTTGSGTYY